MTLKEFRDFFTSELSDIYPNTEIQSIFNIVLEEFLDLKRIDVVMYPDKEINEKDLTHLNKVIARLQDSEPLQYIIGETEFYGLPFKVNSHVLIPRPETEELVEWVLSEVVKLQKAKETISILDIGTGSGCIPISIKKNQMHAAISAIDISEEAIEVASHNAKINNVPIHFIQKDILSTTQLDEKYDIIISNPPYVRQLEKKEMNSNVLEHEPELALFVSDDAPLIFYHKIAQLAKDHLHDNGLLFFEINEYLGKEMLEMLRLLGFQNVLLKKDLFGKDRMIKATK